MVKGTDTLEKHPIRVVARRTGLTPDLLRAWERRYGAVTPSRASGRRLYTDADVERLVLLRRATFGGRGIGQVAHLSTKALGELVEADERAAARSPDRARALSGVSEIPMQAGQVSIPHLSDAIEATLRLDGGGLERALSRARLALGDVAVIERVVAPLMRTVGDMWQQGSMRVAHEHLSTSIVRTFLGNLAGGAEPGESAPSVVFATPVGQLHELGALLAAAAAASEGWQVTYLGPNLPVEEIAAAVQAKDARALGLSIVFPPDDPRVSGEIRKLREMIGQERALLVGGAASGAYAADLEAAGAARIADMPSLRAVLGSLRREGPRV